MSDLFCCTECKGCASVLNENAPTGHRGVFVWLLGKLNRMRDIPIVFPKEIKINSFGNFYV